MWQHFFRTTSLLAFTFLFSGICFGQEDQVIIGDDGIMRWRHDSTEITGFGVNYTVPFAHAYRKAKELGIDIKTAIDQDVYHFTRLGFDLFRVHVWDTEISDTLGNLLENEHLDLFDYLLSKLNQRGIKAVITPIAYWGNGWPERDLPTPGFSHQYGKEDCLTNPEAIKAQENYLAQFVNHVNPYRNIAYKNDPMIIAFEVCNEPHHRGTPEEVTTFVRRMKDAIRSTGTTKPVFYNVTHSIHLAEAYYQAGIDGGTFQWYPTGLGFQKELQGNMLPNVDRYTIPFEDVLKKYGSARFVYEFDAADMASTYMYPAMARSFRSAGMQLATHFSYDPTYLAPYNTEYNTHYMNLAYAPRKALALMISGEVFRHIPLYADYRTYPGNTSFGPFRVSYEEDLAEMLTAEKYIYTNHTDTRIDSYDSLKLIAGWGNSEVVEYDGTGAYFLNKIGDGIWRLEIMPDVIVTDNLFGWNDISRKRAVIKHNRHKMKINLPEFTDGMLMQSIDWRDSIIYREARWDYVDVNPGIYMLITPAYREDDSVDLHSILNIRLDEYFAPPTNADNNCIPYETKRNRKSEEIILFEPVQDSMWLNRRWVPGARLMKNDENDYLYFRLNGLFRQDNENPNAVPVGDYTIRHYFGDLIEPGKKELNSKKTIVVNAFTPGGFEFPMQISLVMKDGSAFGTTFQLDSVKQQHRISLSDLKKVQAVLMPRPYPTFLPYYSTAGKSDLLDLNQIESLQISIGPGIRQDDWSKVYEVMIGSVQLE